MEILLLGHHISKNILQHQQFVESLAELSEPIQTPSSVMTFAVICGLVLMRLLNLQIYNITQMQGLWSTLHWCKTARKLSPRQNENQKSVQACDLKSALSEHAKDAGQCNDYWLGKPPAFRQDTQVHKHSYLAAGNEPWSGLFMEQIILQPHQNKAVNSLIRTRLWITANVCITDDRIRMGSESSAKLSTTCWHWRTFFVILISYFDYLLDY